MTHNDDICQKKFFFVKPQSSEMFGRLMKMDGMPLNFDWNFFLFFLFDLIIANLTNRWGDDGNE